MMTRNECAGWLLQNDRFLILTHRRPDGDTLGASAALCRGLRNLGKQAYVLENPEITPRYAWLHEGLTKAAPEENDILVCVDVAAPELLPKNAAANPERIALRIDHHKSATGFTPMAVVDPASASCAEMVYDILSAMESPLDAHTAEAVYVGLSTDTGCFRYANTTDHSFLVAAACARAGAPIYRLNQLLFETQSLARLRMQGWMVEHTKIFGGGKLAVCAIPKAVEQELQANEDDLDNISGFPRTIAGVCMAATLRETGDGRCKLSVRALPGYDAAAICAKFGGGGHAGAAGASTDLPLQEAEQAVIKTLEDNLAEN